MEITESIKILKALADPSRLMIVNSLIDKPQYVEELSQRIDLAVSTVSFHLKKLENAGLVYKKKEQYYVVFHANKDIFDYSLKELIAFENVHKVSQDERIRSYREKVLATFFSGGKLQRMPSQYKKRLIILDEIIKLFNTKKTYPEKEVDSKIKDIYDDYCSVRRYFIEEGMMFRKKGEYRLNPEYINESSSSFAFLTADGKDDKEKTNIHKNKTAGKEMTEDRAEIKKKYKLTPRPMGMYQIKTKLNDNIYIGSKMDLNAIKNRHIAELNLGIHKIDDLKNAWDKFGEEGVIFEVLDKLEPKEDPEYNYTDDLETLEELWIEKLKETGKNYFLLRGTTIKNKI